jgi:hypothetical protein
LWVRFPPGSPDLRTNPQIFLIINSRRISFNIKSGSQWLYRSSNNCTDKWRGLPARPSDARRQENGRLAVAEIVLPHARQFLRLQERP